MSEIKNYNNSYQIRIKNIKDFISEENIIKKDYLCSKREAFFEYKFSIENLLELIKNIQIDLISKETCINTNKNIRRIISLFKEDLSSIMKRNCEVYENIKKEIIKGKKNLKQKIQAYNDLNNINYIAEKEQLKYINFNIENEIKAIDFLIQEKEVLKHSGYFGALFEQKMSREKEEINTCIILEDKKKKLQKELKGLTMKRSKQNEEIKKILVKISDIKNKINENKSLVFKESKNSFCNKKHKYRIIRQRFDIYYKNKLKKYDDKHEVKNNSNSESSNKETNGSSVKNNIFDINKLYDDNHINYDCLKNKFLFDIDNNKILKSFNSSKDSEFSQNNI